MNYDDENWIKVYTRDTAGWLSVSWQARGLSLELARKLPRHTGELSLGRKGLATIAALLRAPWSEIEPFIRELIDDGRLVYNEERQTISDPEHVARQTTATSAAERQRRAREAAAAAAGNGASPPDAPASRAVTRSHAASREGTASHEKKRREEKEEKEETPPSGGIARAPEATQGSRCLRPDEPLTEQRRKDHIAQIGTLPMRDVEPEWRAFVDHRISITKLFQSSAAIDADWRGWVRRQNVIDAKARVAAQNDNSGGRTRGRGERQPLGDPNADWLKTGSDL